MAVQTQEYKLEANYLKRNPAWKIFPAQSYAFFLVECLTGQSSAPDPHPNGARLFTIFWLYFAIIIGGYLAIDSIIVSFHFLLLYIFQVFIVEP
jgi:hypothetical protein